MKTYDNSEIKEFILKYKLQKEDVILLSELHKQRLPYEKVLFSRDYSAITKKIRQIEKRYKLKFLDIGLCSILFDKAPLISDSNYDEIMGPTKKELALEKAREKAEQEDRKRKEEKAKKQKEREQRLENLERLKRRLYDEKFKKCPDCAEDVKKEARVCKHCRYRWE